MPKPLEPPFTSPLVLLALPLCLGAWLSLGPGVEVAAAAAPPPMGGGGAGPEEEACAGRSLGDACTLPNRQLGTCGRGTCNRLDYSKGSPPTAVEEACVVCQSGGASPSDTGPAAPAGAKPGGQDAAGGSASNAGPGSKDSDKEPPESSSRCRVDPTTGGPGGAGKTGGLAALVLLAWVRRGRRARAGRKAR